MIQKIKNPLIFLLSIFMVLSVFAGLTFTAEAKEVTPKYKIVVNNKTLISSAALPYTTTADAIRKKLGYTSYTATYVKHYKNGNIMTFSGLSIVVNKYGQEQIDIGLKKTGKTGHITPTVTVTPVTSCVCDVTGYTGVYDGEAHTIGALTVTSPASGATVKYGTASGTYDLTEPPSFTEAGTHTVYYQVAAGGWVTKTGSVDVVINPKPVTVTAFAQSKIHGTDDPAFTYTVDGLLGSDALTGELTREPGETPGTYAILQGTLSAGANYAIEFGGASLTVEPNVADDIAAAKAAAKAALAAYKNADDYRAAEQAVLAAAIESGNTAIDAAADLDAVAAALANAKTALDEIKTDAQLTAEEQLAAAKESAKATVNAVNAADYITADQQTVTDAKTTALAAIEAATTEEEVTTALNNFNNAIASCTTQVVADQIAQVMSEVSAKTGSDMTYTGNPIQLINTPTTALPAGYTMKYAVTTENTAPTDESLYTTSIPTATDAGTYYVWYKVVGDSNHNDTQPACVSVTIAAPHVHQFDPQQGAIPRWSWHQTGNTWEVTVKYECSCGEITSETVTATVTKEENNGKVTFTADDGEDNTDSRTFDLTVDITKADGSEDINGLAKGVAYGTQVKLTTAQSCDWKVNGVTVSQNTNYIWVTAKGDMEVEAKPTENEQAVGSLSLTATKGAAGKVKLIINYALPKGATVKSAILHRGYVNDSNELVSDTQTSFKSKLTKTNGTYTANISVSKAQKYGGWAEVKFTYNDKTYELKTSLFSSEKG